MAQQSVERKERNAESNVRRAWACSASACCLQMILSAAFWRTTNGRFCVHGRYFILGIVHFALRAPQPANFAFRAEYFVERVKNSKKYRRKM